MYLTYRELFSIHAICEWCASSAVILTLLFIAAVYRYVTASDGVGPVAPPPLPPKRPASGSASPSRSKART